MNTKLSVCSEIPRSMELAWTPISLSIGLAYVFRSQEGICQISLHNPNRPLPDPSAVAQKIFTNPHIRQDKGWEKKGLDLIEGYLNGRSIQQQALSLYGTPFQIQVWKALQKVPHGRTMTYQQLALKAGFSERHARPVGSAVGANPVAILIPCHRILPASGEIGNFGWGIDFKKKLLELETDWRQEMKAYG